VGLNEALPCGATPLDADELDGLIPTHLSTRSQLNEWERQNIESALIWLAKLRRHQALDALWLCRLHREMFGKTWLALGRHISVHGQEHRGRLEADPDAVAGADRIAVSFHRLKTRRSRRLWG
jgi:hypothetical protein